MSYTRTFADANLPTTVRHIKPGIDVRYVGKFLISNLFLPEQEISRGASALSGGRKYIYG